MSEAILHRTPVVTRSQPVAGYELNLLSSHGEAAAAGGAAIGKIEALLKRDAALSYKLLRYIDSAGFGLSCQVQSFRHAVTVLVYQNLHRWLGCCSDRLAREALNKSRAVRLAGCVSGGVCGALRRGSTRAFPGHAAFACSASWRLPNRTWPSRSSTRMVSLAA
jgi:hypothetical protein